MIQFILQSYIISVEASCGSRLYLNDQLLLRDRMPMPLSEGFVGESDVLLLTPQEDGPVKVSSHPINLRSTQRYKLDLEMIHASHLLWNNPEKSSIRLLWRNALQDENSDVHIPKTSLYKTIGKPPLKISRLDPDNFEVVLLFNGQYAYIDSKNHFIADLPLKFEGRKLVRPRLDQEAKKFTVQFNIPVTIFVAFPDKFSFPLTLIKKKTRMSSVPEVFSIFLAENHHTRATEAELFRIQFLQQKKPNELLEFEVTHPHVPFFVFAEPLPVSEASCAGEAVVLSRPDNETFKKCSASSSLSEDFNCFAGLSGKFMDQPNGTWRGKSSNGAGEFIELEFSQLVELSSLKFKPLDDPLSWPAELALSFDEDMAPEEGQSVQTFSVFHSNNLYHFVYKLEPVITRKVRITITKLYVSNESTGGSFELKGVPCKSQSKDKENDEKGDKEGGEFFNKEAKLGFEECWSALDSVPEALPLNVGKLLRFTCNASCLDDLDLDVEESEEYLGLPPEDLSVLEDEKPQDQNMTSTEENNGESFMTLKTRFDEMYIQRHRDLSREENEVAPTDIRVYGDDKSGYAPESSVCGAAIHSGICKAGMKDKCLLNVYIEPSPNAFPGVVRFGLRSHEHGPSYVSFRLSKPPIPSSSRPPVHESFVFGSEASVKVPKGFHLDSCKKQENGSEDKDHEDDSLSFGWSSDVLFSACDLKKSIYSGGCKFRTESGEPSVWSISLPKNKRFVFHMALGDPCGTAPVEAFVQVNEKPALKGYNIKAGEIFWKKILVSSGSDGQARISSNCGGEFGECPGDVAASADGDTKSIAILALKIEEM
eukprot:GHVP01027796.1.p1 GENE.GHVP01027796.1~~GHVP01027796.1.p1  ORF type:complete len:822 (+),score=171.36 GHVP01027796.1:2825-5290(+)